jgi:hypothetical protein
MGIPGDIINLVRDEVSGNYIYIHVTYFNGSKDGISHNEVYWIQHYVIKFVSGAGRSVVFSIYSGFLFTIGQDLYFSPSVSCLLLVRICVSLRPCHVYYWSGFVFLSVHKS